MSDNPKHAVSAEAAVAIGALGSEQPAAGS